MVPRKRSLLGPLPGVGSSGQANKLCMSKTQGQYLSPRVTNLVLQYLTHAVKLASSWKALRPEALPLLQRVIFPLLCFNEDDARLWQDDPQEFIRKVCRQSSYGFASHARISFQACQPCCSSRKWRLFEQGLHWPAPMMCQPIG